MIDEDVRTSWVQDLRSGEYLQGKSQLRRGDRYCCLGLLCLHQPDVSFKPYVGPDVDHDTSYQAFMESSADAVPFLGYPPDALMERLGLSMEAAEALVEINDSDAGTFDIIADCIESGWVTAPSGEEIQV